MALKSITSKWHYILLALLPVEAAAIIPGGTLYLTSSPDLAKAGEKLLYPGFGGRIDIFHMPLAPIICAALAYPVYGVKLATLVSIFILSLCALLTFSLAAVLYSPVIGFVAGTAAVVGFLLFNPDMEQLVYSSVLLCLGNVLVFRFSDDKIKDLLIGIATALTLTVKCVLLPFPVVYLLATAGGSLRRDFWRRALSLLGPSVLMIVLWGAANFPEWHSFVFLDSARGANNLIGGSMGVGGTYLMGDMKALAGIDASANVMPWVIKNIISHPLIYGWGVIKRLALVLSLQPVLLMCAVAGLWINRRRENIMLLALLCGFFLFTHCLMAIAPRFFTPLWFLLLPLAAGLVSFSKTGLEVPRKNPEAATVAFGASAAILCLLVGISIFFTLRHPFFRARSIEEYKLVTDRNPDNAWLLEQYGNMSLENGDMDSALDALSRAYGLDRSSLSGYASALFISGRYHDVGWERLKAILTSSRVDDCRNLLVLSLMAIEEERYADARLFIDRYREFNNQVRDPSDAHDLKLQQNLRARSMERIAGHFEEMLGKLLPQRIKLICSRFSLVYPEMKDIVSVKQLLFNKSAQKAAVLSEKGVEYAQSGKLDLARDELLSAIALEPRYVPAYSTLAYVYIQQGQRDKACEVYRKAIEANSDADFFPSLLATLREDHKACQSGK